MRIAVCAFVAALAPGLALADVDDPAGMTCAAFSALDVETQMVTLSTLEPFGDDMNASDAAASRQWAADVTAACSGHPDLLLPEAARQSMGE